MIIERVLSLRMMPRSREVVNTRLVRVVNVVYFGRRWNLLVSNVVWEAEAGRENAIWLSEGDAGVLLFGVDAGRSSPEFPSDKGKTATRETPLAAGWRTPALMLGQGSAGGSTCLACRFSVSRATARRSKVSGAQLPASRQTVARQPHDRGASRKLHPGRKKDATN